MKFNKILMVGFERSNFEEDYWDKMNLLCKEIVLLPSSSPGASKHLDADCLLVRLGASVTREDISKMPALKYIGMYGTGVGRIDLEHAASKRVTVTNIKGYSTEGVAELVFGLLLEHVRELERAKKQAREGNYSESSFEGCELKGKKLGVIGLGRIGGRVAEIALGGFGAEVSYWSKNRKQDCEEKGVKFQEIETLLKQCDFVSINLEYNKDTKGIISEKLIESIKPGAVVVNVSPMELIDISALGKRLQNEDITFILDHSDELSAEDSKRLSRYKNCVMYPPIGYITRESTAKKKGMFVDNLENFLRGSPSNKIN